MNYDPSKIRKYYYFFRKSISSFYFILLFSSIFSLIVAGYFIGIENRIFWIFSATIIGLTILQMLVFRRISKPQLDLSKVIFGISNKITPEKIPNPHAEKYGNSGFSEVLKFIYALDYEPENKNEKSPALKFSQIKSIPEIMRNSKLGFAVLNTENKIVFKHNAVNFSKLRKNKVDEIATWIEEARQRKIRDSKVWERVSNIADTPENQRLYDIVVFFEKQFENDILIYFIDKTANYEREESDLNFFAFAAHEIRGPITIIRGYLDILSMELSGLLSDEQRELFTRLIVSSNKLNGYINNILNVAKFDQDRLEFSLEEHEISEIFDSISEDITVRASSQNRNLQINLPHNLPTVGTDIYGASEVIINLVDNAIKYSSDGGMVKIWAEENGAFVDVHVEDYGIGMPENVVNNIFTKFFRSHRSRETVAGSGIGLYISKAIIEKMKGKISAKSVEGKGSNFTLSIPIYAKLSEISQLPSAQIKNHGRVF
ncbi:MAG: HAMP domain-containing sensor histidine kinase [bacterium]|nr:HAMP domain-containing sensor histidine kinase [bacterium]